MLGLKLIHVDKRGPCYKLEPIKLVQWQLCFQCRRKKAQIAMMPTLWSLAAPVLVDHNDNIRWHQWR